MIRESQIPFAPVVLENTEPLRRIGRQMRLQGIALENSANAIVITDRQGTIYWTNPAFSAITGYSAEEALGRNPRFLKSGQHEPAFYGAMWRTLAAGQTWRGTLTNRRKNGTTYTGEETITPVRADDGTITHFVAIINDVTARDAAQTALHATQARLQHLMENSPAVAYGWKLAEGRIVSQVVSENIEHILGCPARAAMDPAWWIERLHPDDRKEAEASLAETAEHGCSHTVYRLRDDTGSYRWIEDIRRVVPGPAMEFVGLWQDVTARKKAEEVVRELSAAKSDQRHATTLRDIVALAGLTLAVFFVGEKFSLFERFIHSSEKENPHFDETLGAAMFLSAGLLVFSYRRWRESRDESLSQVQLAEAMRHLHAETEKQVQQRTAELAHSNDALRTEIAERHRAEQALRLFRAQVDQSSDTFEVIDPATGRFIDVSDHGPAQIGCTREEYLAMRVCDLDPTIEPSTWPRMAETIRAAGSHSGEGFHRRKDGTLFPVEYDCRWVRLDRDYIVTVIRDITARKAAEAALQEQQEQWRTLVANSASAVFVVQDEQFALANPAAVRLLGAATEEEIVGRGVFDVIPEDLKPRIRQRMQQAFGQDGPLPLFEWTARRLDGRMAEVESTSVRFHFRGRPAMLVEARDISERKRADTEKRETETRFRELAENIQEVFWLSNPEKNEMLYVSPAYERIWGRPCESLYSTPHSWLNAIHPGDLSRVIAALPGQPWGDYDVEFRITRPDGTERWIRDRAFPVRDYQGRVVRVAGIAKDITERKHAALRLELQLEVTQLLAEDASPELMGRRLIETIGSRLNWEYGEIWLVDRQIRALRCSQVWHVPTEALAAMADVSRRLTIGPGEGLVGRAWASAQPATETAVAGHPHCLRSEKVDAAGLRSWVGLPIGQRQETLGVLSFFTSKSGPFDPAMLSALAGLGTQFAQWMERRQLAEQFRQAQKLEAIGTLAGGIAHDFNNIIAAINGYAELAKLELGEDSPVREYFDAVINGGARAASLVRQILAFSRQQEHERVPIQLRHVVREALDLLRATIPATIEIDCQCDRGLPAVLADATQVHQVLMNLGTNAWHAMKDRAGRLGVTVESFAVDDEMAAQHAELRPGSYVRISVSDTGCGMDQATLGRIFEPFFTTKAPGDGTGLGLAVVHGIMQTHEGAVTVYSHPGDGTVFRLYFPVAANEAVEVSGASPMPPRGNGERVLYVDDEKPLGLLTRKVLEQLGYQAEVLASPVDALEAVRSDPRRYDLVVTDLAMPGMSGVELAEELLKIRPDLPIVLVTGYTATLTPAKLRAMGMRDLLSKPVSVQALGATVARVLAEAAPV